MLYMFKTFVSLLSEHASYINICITIYVSLCVISALYDGAMWKLIFIEVGYAETNCSSLPWDRFKGRVL
jgi:hypothetical protein